jgi:hypothetical protein
MFLTTILLVLLRAQVPHPAETALLIHEISQAENVDALLLAKMVVVESRGKPNAVNKKTGDYGIAQINLKSHPNITKACAMDARCGLEAGARILAKAKRPCVYNLGAIGAKRNPKSCLRYEDKLASIN